MIKGFKKLILNKNQANNYNHHHQTNNNNNSFNNNINNIKSKHYKNSSELIS
jgi:hypothetical protein